MNKSAAHHCVASLTVFSTLILKKVFSFLPAFMLVETQENGNIAQLILIIN